MGCAEKAGGGGYVVVVDKEVVKAHLHMIL